MKRKILLVEDTDGQEFFLRGTIISIPSSIEVLPKSDSLQDVIDDVVNQGLVPDCAIVDAHIFQETKAVRKPSATQDTCWGIEVVEHLIRMGMQPEKILVLTAYKDQVQLGLGRVGLSKKIRVIEKPIHSNKLKSVLIELLTNI